MRLLRNGYNIYLYYDFQPVELLLATYYIFCSFPFFVTGYGLYDGTTNPIVIHSVMLSFSFFQIFCVLSDQLFLRKFANLLQLLLSFYILFDLQDSFDIYNCFNVHAILTPTMYLLVWMRSVIQLHSSNESGN